MGSVVFLIMRVYDIEKLAEILKCEHEEAGINVLVQCPFAEWTHEKGTDMTPSMSIKINDRGSSPYFCHGCGESGRKHGYDAFAFG